MNQTRKKTICFFFALSILLSLIPTALAADPVIYMDLYNNEYEFIANQSQTIELDKTYKSESVSGINGVFTISPEDKFEISFNATQTLSTNSMLVKIPINENITENFTNLKFIYENGTLLESYKVWTNDTDGCFIVRYPVNTIGSHKFYATFENNTDRTETTTICTNLIANASGFKILSGLATNNSRLISAGGGKYTDAILLFGGSTTRYPSSYPQDSVSIKLGNDSVQYPRINQSGSHLFFEAENGSSEPFNTMISDNTSILYGAGVFTYYGMVYSEIHLNNQTNTIKQYTRIAQDTNTTSDAVNRINFTAIPTFNLRDSDNSISATVGTPYTKLDFGTNERRGLESNTTFQNVNYSSFSGLTLEAAVDPIWGSGFPYNIQAFCPLFISYTQIIDPDEIKIMKVGGYDNQDFNVSIGIPTTEYFTNISGIEFASNGTLNFSIEYMPSILDFEIDNFQDRGQLNFSYKPIATASIYEWEISNNSNFSTIIRKGQTDFENISTDGKVNVKVVDFQNLTVGQYFVRVTSPESGEFSVLASGNTTLQDSVGFDIRILDGITGNWLNVTSDNFSNATQIYPIATLGGNITTASAVNHIAVNQYITNSSITVTQGGNTQTYQGYTTDSNGTRWEGNSVGNITLREPVTISINASGTRQWMNQTYVLTLEEYMVNDGLLNLSVERRLSTYTNSTYGIVHDVSGEPVSTASYTVNNSTTGLFVGTYPAANGGQYAFRNPAAAATMFYKFTAPGYWPVDGTIGVIKQDIRMLGAPTITIKVRDSDTQEEVRYFTTFLGDNQTIRSTDNGVVTYDNISEGRHQVIIQANGYAQASREIFVTPNSTDFVLFVTKSEGEQTWVDKNFVNFTILDQTGGLVYDTNVKIETLDGFLKYDKTLFGAASFVTELNRTTNYKITITKESENISQELFVYGSSLSGYMYIYVEREMPKGPPNLVGNTTVNFDASNGLFTVRINSTDPRITELYFQNTTASYYITKTGERGYLGQPEISDFNRNITATWNIRGIDLSNSAIVTADITIKSSQTGDQEVNIRKTMNAQEIGGTFLLLSSNPDLKIDLGLTPSQMEMISIVILLSLALVTASAGIPYASTLIPTVTYVVLFWAGWISLPTGILVLLAIGLGVVAYDMIKRTRT